MTLSLKVAASVLLATAAAVAAQCPSGMTFSAADNTCLWLTTVATSYVADQSTGPCATVNGPDGSLHPTVRYSPSPRLLGPVYASPICFADGSRAGHTCHDI